MPYVAPVRSQECLLVNLYEPQLSSTGSVCIPYAELPEKLSNLGRRFHLKAREKGYKVSVGITQHGYVVTKR